MAHPCGPPGSSPALRALSPQVLQQAEGRHRQGVWAGKEVPPSSGPMAQGYQHRAPSFPCVMSRSRARPRAGDGQRRKSPQQSGARLLGAGHEGPWRMSSAFSLPGAGGGLTTLGRPLGSFAEPGMARPAGVLGAQRESLGGGGKRSSLLTAGSSQGSALKCQSLGLTRCPRKCPLGTSLRRPFLQLSTMPACSLFPTPQLGQGPSPWGWVLAVLGFAGDSSILPLQPVSLTGVPLPVLCPKSHSRGVFS